MTDVLTHNPETENAGNANRKKWYQTLGNKLMNFGKRAGAPTPHATERSPWAPTPREEMTEDQKFAEDWKDARRENRIRNEAEIIADRVTKEYSDPNSVYSQRHEAANKLHEAAVNEVLNPQGSNEKASDYAAQSRQQRDYGNAQVENTFTSSKNEVTKQDVMDALHRQAIKDRADAANTPVETTNSHDSGEGSDKA